MLSTDNNINHPLKRVELDPMKMPTAFYMEHTVELSREEFDLIQVKDMKTLYIVRSPHSPRPELYYGDIRISRDDKRPEYLLGVNNENEFVIYMNQHDEWYDFLVEIRRFKDPQDAMDALYLYKKVTTPNQLGLVIHNALATYIRKECGVHEAIVSIIAGNGYRDDPRLQHLNEYAMSYGYQTNSRDIPHLMRRMLHNISSREEHTLWPIYSKIYDVFVMYDFFIDKKYTEPLPEELDLAEPISQIIKALQ